MGVGGNVSEERSLPCVKIDDRCSNQPSRGVDANPIRQISAAWRKRVSTREIDQMTRWTDDAVITQAAPRAI
jgi:hypothetical protein